MTNIASPLPGSLDDMKAWLAALVAQERPGRWEPVYAGTPFMDLGLDSMSAVTLIGTLEMALGIELPPSLFWDFEDIGALAEFLVTKLGKAESS